MQNNKYQKILIIYHKININKYNKNQLKFGIIFIVLINVIFLKIVIIYKDKLKKLHILDKSIIKINKKKRSRQIIIKNNRNKYKIIKNNRNKYKINRNNRDNRDNRDSNRIQNIYFCNLAVELVTLYFHYYDNTISSITKAVIFQHRQSN